MLHLKHRNKKNNLKKKLGSTRKCNLCGQPFVATIAHRFFCEGCRAHNELLRFDDWLPGASADVSEDFVPNQAA